VPKYIYFGAEVYSKTVWFELLVGCINGDISRVISWISAKAWLAVLCTIYQWEVLGLKWT